MTLYYIERIGGHGLDENYAMVINAHSVKQAREMAAAQHADEWPVEWLDEKRSFVEELHEQDPAGIVLIACNGAG